MEQADASVDTPQVKLSSRPSTASSSNTNKSTVSLIRKENEIDEILHDDSKDSKDLPSSPSSSAGSPSPSNLSLDQDDEPTYAEATYHQSLVPGTPEQTSPPSTSPKNQGSRVTLINNESETDL